MAELNDEMLFLKSKNNSKQKYISKMAVLKCSASRNEKKQNCRFNLHFVTVRNRLEFENKYNENN